MILIHLDYRIVGKTAAAKRQKAGRIYFARVAYEHHAFAVANAKRRRCPRRIAPSPRSPRAGQRIAAVLEYEAAIMRRLGRLHGIRLVLCMIPELFENLLIFLGQDTFFFQTPAHGHQKKYRPHGNSLPANNWAMAST